jgi:preprotein translocase subunit SecA
MNKLGIKRLNVFAPYKKILRSASLIADRTDDLKKEYRKLTNQELSKKTEHFLELLKNGHSLDSFIHEAFATVRESV